MDHPGRRIGHESRLRPTPDQALVLASLAGVTALAWLYLVHMARHGSGMAMSDAMLAAHPGAGLAAFGLTALMWAVMMVGMMLPSAVPMVLLFTAVQRRHAARPGLRTALFVAGYLVVWGGFAILAAGAQSLLAGAALLSESLTLTGPWPGGLLFLAAALYELSPLKRRCLDGCQGPVAFIVAHWRPGAWGALRMGLAHGAYCLGCCWVLMLLLFVGGVMNLAWVGLLAALVLAQKLAPGGVAVARATSAVLALAGLVLLVRAL